MTDDMYKTQEDVPKSGQYEIVGTCPWCGGEQALIARRIKWCLNCGLKVGPVNYD